MDWIEITTRIVLPTVTSLATVIATIIAAGTAVWGIRAWQREYTGKRRIDLAENVLALVYEIQDVLASVRSPLGHPEEGQTCPEMPDAIDKEKAMLNTAYIPIERFNSRKELFARLRSLRYRFMALNGKDTGQPFEELNSIRRSLAKPYYSMRLHLKELHRKIKTTDPKEYDQMLEYLWEDWNDKKDKEEYSGNGDDLVLKQCKAVIEKFDVMCRKAIGAED